MSTKGIELEFVCPFCPLHCDDVSIESPPDCKILEEALARIEAGDCVARIGDQRTEIKQAERAARKQIEESEQVVLSVRSATLGQAKAIINSGWLIHAQVTSATVAVQKTVERCGVVAATLGDVKQHADAIVVLGNIDETIPRLIEKLDRSAKFNTIDRLGANAIADLATDVRQGRKFASSAYVAFLLDVEAFDADQAGPISELLIETIIWMNSPKRELGQRAVLIVLDPLASLRCVSAWSGDQILVTTKDWDSTSVTLRIGEPNAGCEPADIQIGGTDPGPERAAMYLPASTSGVHHADAVIRGDSTVTLPLRKIQASTAPSVADWISRLS